MGPWSYTLAVVAYLNALRGEGRGETDSGNDRPVDQLLVAPVSSGWRNLTLHPNGFSLH
jgi:hypothetical protein